MGGLISTLAFPVPNKEWSRADLLQRERADELVFLTTKSGYKIPAVHIRRDEGKITLLYSHGNAEDVGLSLPYLDRLSQCCDCSVLAYEYCGYSVAEGEASEKNCYECIDAAYHYLTEGGVDPARIVIFGRSLGTGPTVDLAARLLSKADKVCCKLGGVILQSPLESAGRCVLGEMASYALYPLDLFRSYEKIAKLAPTPVLILHGMADEVVPYSNGEALHMSLEKERTRLYLLKGESNNELIYGDGKISVKYPPKWIPNVGHNNMPEFECLNDVTKFLCFLDERQRNLKKNHY